MIKVMLKKVKESGLPILFLVALVGLVFAFNPQIFNLTLFINFILGSVIVLLGQMLFLQGVSTSLIKVGKHSGSALMKIKKVWLILLFGFVFGFVATIAEPDVQVLADLISPNGDLIKKLIFMLVMGLGVGVMTLVAYVRILKDIPLKYVLTAIYVVILILAAFAKENFVMLAFDSAGTTTGVITVPFLLALTIGICNVREKNKKEDNFGVVAIATSGSIITILIMSFFMPLDFLQMQVNLNNFWITLFNVFIEVLLALIPIFIVFLIMQFSYFKFPFKYFLKIIMGYFLTALGLILFLTGLLFAFAPLGSYLGQNIASPLFIFILSLGLGVVLVFFEPSIKILLMQIEEVSSGLIKKKFVYLALIISVCLALILCTLRMYLDFSYWWYLAPLAALAIGLMYFTPSIFYTIAFDSGGIVAGTILTSFILPFYIGLSNANYGGGLNALGVIGVITLAPVIALEVLGIIYKIYEKKKSISLKEEKNE